MLKYLLVLVISFIFISCGKKENETVKEKVETIPITKIAFGSCGHQEQDQPILSLAAQKSPDLFIFLGDNIYGDTDDMNVLKKKYDMLGSKPEFQELWSSTKVYSVWDDHDFGRNDAGRHYEYKKESHDIFMDFWKVDKNSERFKREGIYGSEMFEYGDKKLQLIMLDLRTFRDRLRPYSGSRDNDSSYHYQLDYDPWLTADSTIMGEDQWNWLEKEFDKQADIRIIASSTQFGITHNGYEAWANFPHEKQKMMNLINTKKTNGVVFISGDVHYSEISKQDNEGGYPIYDFTSSGITSKWDFATPNDNRIEGAIMENHFGLIEIDWNKNPVTILMKCINVQNNTRFERTINLDDISFK